MKLDRSSLNTTLPLQLTTQCKTMGFLLIFLFLKWMELLEKRTTRIGQSQETHFPNIGSNLTSLGTAIRIISLMQQALSVTMTRLTVLNSITPSIARIKVLHLFTLGSLDQVLNGSQRHQISLPRSGLVLFFANHTELSAFMVLQLTVKIPGTKKLKIDSKFLPKPFWMKKAKMIPISSYLARGILWSNFHPSLQTLFEVNGIANLNTSVSKANWNTNYIVAPSVGFTILSELLLDFHGKSVGLMANWTDKIVMAKLAKVRAGDKRKIYLGIIDDYGSVAGPKTKRRLNDGSGPSHKIDISHIRTLNVEISDLDQAARVNPLIKIEEEPLRIARLFLINLCLTLYFLPKGFGWLFVNNSKFHHETPFLEL
ncbi:hypothetical protein LIER_37037 [Lithospermum erythrorhizon]|uniref:Uncharacterized protein n=1 Tax=Lithospermum erythrorhizon TaxID=34254 RepID=A0AAV3PGB1_LITER